MTFHNTLVERLRPGDVLRTGEVVARVTVSHTGSPTAKQGGGRVTVSFINGDVETYPVGDVVRLNDPAVMAPPTMRIVERNGDLTLRVAEPRQMYFACGRAGQACPYTPAFAVYQGDTRTYDVLFCAKHAVEAGWLKADVAAAVKAAGGER